MVSLKSIRFSQVISSNFPVLMYEKTIVPLQMVKAF